ncbi:MAG: DNA polymerase III subunit beta [Candidatus Bathyarchaeia archaeon]
MRLSIKRELLKKVVDAIGKVVGKSQDAILHNILVKKEEYGLSWTGTNLEQSITVKTPLQVLKDEPIYETIIPFDILRDIVSRLSEDEIEIEMKEKQFILDEKNGKYALKAFESQTFPIIPDVKTENKFYLDTKTITSMIEKTAFATAKREESRREFKGVFFEIDRGTINLVATDSTALAWFSVKYEGLEPIQFIIPFRAVEAFQKLPLDYESNTLFEVSDEVIRLTNSDISLTSLLINGSYPDYRSVVPSETDYYAIVEKEELLEALEHIEPVAKKGSGRISFTFSNKGLTLETQCSDVGSAMKKVKCETNAEMYMQFYAEKIIEGIEKIDAQSVHFGINDPLKPVLIRGIEDENYLYVIMPQKPIV